MKEQRITSLSVKDLKEFKGNPRRMTLKEMAKLKNSLENFGYVELIIIDEENRIIGGHQRIKPMSQLGYYEPVDMVQLSGYSESEKKAINIALNKISEDWDRENSKSSWWT